jgi:hypothetical protein
MPQIQLTRKALWCTNHENPSNGKSQTWAPLKGLYHEMDLAFDDMYG